MAKKADARERMQAMNEYTANYLRAWAIGLAGGALLLLGYYSALAYVLRVCGVL